MPLTEQWQPIETAPKDGARILACGPKQQVVIVRWGRSEPFGDEPEWTTDSEGPGYSRSFDDGSLTDWMPLPTPPQRAAADIDPEDPR